jgi:RimJ/RimL family protein N-acetyltransferase
MLLIRAMEPHDYDFLMDMHYESIYIVQGKPPRSELLNSPGIVKYNENWGRAGDKAVIALVDNQPAGAAWYRLFDEMNQGYGFVDVKTPELGIAIHSGHRQQGVGIALMEAIIQQAVSDGYPSVSLSVDPENQAAVRLYKKLGFEYIRTAGTSWTMKLNLKDKA